MTLPMLRFADRDLMMRFRGGGVGHSGWHKSTREATDFFKKDRHILDVKNSLRRPSDIVEIHENDSEMEECEKMNSLVGSDGSRRGG
jgi:hypothetical protein